MDKKVVLKNLVFLRTMEQRQTERKARWEKLQQKYKETEEEKERRKKKKKKSFKLRKLRREGCY